MFGVVAVVVVVVVVVFERERERVSKVFQRFSNFSRIFQFLACACVVVFGIVVVVVLVVVFEREREIYR